MPDTLVECLLARDKWVTNSCVTWDCLVHGKSNAIDLIDWADALYLTDGHLDPCKVAKAVFDESELCG